MRHWGSVALSERRREGPAAGKLTQADGGGSGSTVGLIKKLCPPMACGISHRLRALLSFSSISK